MVPRDQPKSWCSGSMSRPGRERKAAAPMIVTKVTAATNQARWIRRVRAGRGSLPVFSTAVRGVFSTAVASVVASVVSLTS
ncbi:hypothetical protein SGLAM104S_07344 [Streptomyces glaucescens]